MHHEDMMSNVSYVFVNSNKKYIRRHSCDFALYINDHHVLDV